MVKGVFEMQIMEGPEYYDFSVKNMTETRAIRLDKNEKTVKDVLDSFIQLPGYDISKRGVLIEDDGITYGIFRLDNDVILPKYMNLEVTRAKLVHYKYDSEILLTIYVKPLTKRENIFFEFSEGMLADSKIINFLRDLTFGAHRNGYFVILLMVSGNTRDVIRELHDQNVFVDSIVIDLPKDEKYFIFKCERRL